MTPQMYQEICDKGAVGALFARFFDEAGNEIDCAWNHCCVSISFKHIINVPNVVCIASGIQKAKAVSIAIQKKYINTCLLYTSFDHQLYIFSCPDHDQSVCQYANQQHAGNRA